MKKFLPKCVVNWFAGIRIPAKILSWLEPIISFLEANTPLKFLLKWCAAIPDKLFAWLPAPIQSTLCWLGVSVGWASTPLALVSSADTTYRYISCLIDRKKHYQSVLDITDPAVRLAWLNIIASGLRKLKLIKKFSYHF